MKLNGIEYPEEILNAARNNELVVFAGAGISMYRPSNLPSYKELAQKILQYSPIKYNEKLKPDEQLYEFVKLTEAHIGSIIKNIFEPEKCEPNIFHESIVTLFKSVNNIKIITTNYDDMLEKACKNIYKKLPKTYSYPALPFGHSPYGVIHIHGSLKETNNMLVTSRDLGNAYLINGNNTKFLIDLINKYTVIFVGYSYEDDLIKYITQSIPYIHDKYNYILTDNTDKNWSKYNLVPIYFKSKDYTQEAKSLSEFSKIASRDFQKWNTCIKNEMSKKPPKDNYTISILKEGLQNPYMLRKALKHYSNKAWTLWMMDHIPNNIFTLNEELHTDDYLLLESLSKFLDAPALRQLLEKFNNTLNTSAALYLLLNIDSDNTSTLRLLMTLLINESHSYNNYKLLFHRAIELKQIDIAQIIFYKIIKSKFIINKHYGINGNPYLRISQENFDDSAILNFWEKLKNHKYLNAKECILFACKHIIHTIADIESISFCNEYKYNDWNFFILDNIKINECSTIPEIITDMILSSYKLLDEKNNQYFCQALLKELTESKILLLNKIAITLITNNTIISQKNRFNYLLNSFDLYNPYLKYELFHLAKAVYGKLSISDKNTFLKKLSDTTSEYKNLSNEYQEYNWLVWLNKCFKNDIHAMDKLNKLQANNSNFKPRQNPEQNSTLILGFVEDKSPLNTQQIFRTKHTDLIKKYITYQNPIGLNMPTKDGFRNMIAQCMSDDFNWGIELICCLIDKKIYEEDLWLSLLCNTSPHIHNQQKLFKLLDHLNNKSLIENIPNPICEFMIYTVASEHYNSQLTKRNANLLCILLSKISKTKKFENDNSVANNCVMDIMHTISGNVCRAMCKFLSKYNTLCNDKIVKIISRILNNTPTNSFVTVLFSNISILHKNYNGCIYKYLFKYLNSSNDFSKYAFAGLAYQTSNTTNELAAMIVPAYLNYFQKIDSLPDVDKTNFVKYFIYILFTSRKWFSLSTLCKIITPKLKDKYKQELHFQATCHMRQLSPLEKSDFFNEEIMQY